MAGMELCLVAEALLPPCPSVLISETSIFGFMDASIPMWLGRAFKGHAGAIIQVEGSCSRPPPAESSQLSLLCLFVPEGFGPYLPIHSTWSFLVTIPEAWPPLCSSSFARLSCLLPLRQGEGQFLSLEFQA